MWLSDNRSVFSTVELSVWEERRRLIPAEKFLIERYCTKTGETLEAGTGAGRILFEMKAMGFTSLRGFDLVYPLLAYAKKKESTNTISFELQDAVRLGYKSSSFDQLICLQQIVCFIEDAASRLMALKEAHRVLRPGGRALFSFLSFEARKKSALYLPYLLYLALLRTLNRSNRSIQHLPWLRLGGKFNWASLLDSRPYVYWYKLEEIVQLLETTGFQIAAIGSTRQIMKGMMYPSYHTLVNEPVDGMLYIVANKQSFAENPIRA
jgi:ubiquinone/menaquinone biosynthesis C-methylase UbiE